MKFDPRYLIVEKSSNPDDPVLQRLLQYYEAEFSSITHKKPNAFGLFALDTALDEEHFVYVARYADIPCGFNIIHAKANDEFEVNEFYVVPVYRRGGLGRALATHVFDLHRGSWEIKQIQGAEQARVFWRKTIQHYTQGEYVEDTFLDPYWGEVTRQRFSFFP